MSGSLLRSRGVRDLRFAWLVAVLAIACGSEPKKPHGGWTGDSDSDSDSDWDLDGGPDRDAGPPDCDQNCAILCIGTTDYHCDHGQGLCQLGPFAVCYPADCCDEACGSPCLEQYDCP